MKIGHKLWLKGGILAFGFFSSFCFGLILVKDDFEHNHTMHEGHKHVFQIKNPMIGMPVPPSNLGLFDGQYFDIKDMIKGQKAILFFWRSGCPHCVKALRGQDKTAKQLEVKGIKFISINQGEEIDKIRIFLKNKASGSTCFVDLKGNLASELKVIGVPSYYFINENGLVVRIEHELTEDMIRDFIKSKGIHDK